MRSARRSTGASPIMRSLLETPLPSRSDARTCRGSVLPISPLHVFLTDPDLPFAFVGRDDAGASGQVLPDGGERQLADIHLREFVGGLWICPTHCQKASLLPSCIEPVRHAGVGVGDHVTGQSVGVRFSLKTVETGHMVGVVQ